MRKILLSILISLALTACIPAIAQTNATPAQPTFQDFVTFMQNALANLNTNVDLFSPNEIEVRLGGVYSQSTGEGGILFDVEKKGVWKSVGLGVQAITGEKEGSAGTVASFAYGSITKTLGNVQGELFAGPGYNFKDNAIMGVVGVGVEYRTSDHIGVWARAGYALEAVNKDRGVIAGGGVSYAF